MTFSTDNFFRGDMETSENTSTDMAMIYQNTPMAKSPQEMLAAKAMSVFGAKGKNRYSLVVDKRAVFRIGFESLTRYVKEFLIAAAMRQSIDSSNHFSVVLDNKMISKIRSAITKGTVDPSNIRAFKSNLMDRGYGSLIGNVSIEPKPDKDQHYVHIDQLSDVRIFIEASTRKELTKAHPALLDGPVWGSIGLLYNKRMVVLESFTPYQLTMNARDLRRFKEGRKEFDTLSWINLLITSMGYNPNYLETPNLPLPGMTWQVGNKTVKLVSHPDWRVAYDTGERIEVGKNNGEPIYKTVWATPMIDTGKKTKKGKSILEPFWTPLSRYNEETKKNEHVKDENGDSIFFHAHDLRRKFLLLARLIPLAMKNYHLVELGPRQTGKSYTLRELSPHVYVISGSSVTYPQLIQSLALGNPKPGILKTYQVAVFDEFCGSKGTKIPDDLVNALKDYMESGNLGRGGRSATSNCSIVFGGNIEIAPNGRGPVFPEKNLFRDFPKNIVGDSAFVDRIAAVIPGWELPKITDDFVSPPGVGFLADYFGEVLTKFRKSTIIEAFINSEVEVTATDLNGNPATPTVRDTRSISRTIAGFFKVIYPQPDAETDPAIDQMIFRVACEMRGIVHDQLVKMAPGEYSSKTFQARFKLDPKV